MFRSKCSCGSSQFEDVDVTPVGVQDRRYFTRCKHCGLVIDVHGCAPKKKTWPILSIFSIGFYREM